LDFVGVLEIAVAGRVVVAEGQGVDVIRVPVVLLAGVCVAVFADFDALPAFVVVVVEDRGLVVFDDSSVEAVVTGMFLKGAVVFALRTE